MYQSKQKPKDRHGHFFQQCGHRIGMKFISLEYRNEKPLVLHGLMTILYLDVVDLDIQTQI